MARTRAEYAHDNADLSKANEGLVAANADLRRDPGRRSRHAAGGAGLLAVGAVIFALGLGYGNAGAKPDNTVYATPTTSSSAADGTPIPSLLAMESATAAPAQGAESSQSAQSSLTNPASKDASGNWIVENPDGAAETISTVDGFTPDIALVLAPEYGKTLPIEPSQFADFQSSLNNPKHPLVGYSYGENDQSDNLNYERTLQVPMYSWTVATGLEVDAPGIGHLVGGPGEAVELMIMNVDGSVGDFGSNNPILIKDGFTGTGRIWDGNNLLPDEQGISSHYVNQLQTGVTGAGESGFIGQCNQAANCDKVLVVSVVRRQWGQNPDGTKKFQYQLLREEVVTK
jgi:hypothetical protein